jgi:hypothetical protein
MPVDESIERWRRASEETLELLRRQDVLASQRARLLSANLRILREFVVTANVFCDVLSRRAARQ